MAGGQILNVDIIAEGGAIVGVIVGAEYFKMGVFPECGIEEIGHEIIGGTFGVFADESGGVGADGIEVSQDDNGPRIVGSI